MVKKLMLAVLLAGSVLPGNALATDRCYTPGERPAVHPEECHPHAYDANPTQLLCEILDDIQGPSDTAPLLGPDYISVSMPAECDTSSDG